MARSRMHTRGSCCGDEMHSEPYSVCVGCDGVEKVDQPISTDCVEQSAVEDGGAGNAEFEEGGIDWYGYE